MFFKTKFTTYTRLSELSDSISERESDSESSVFPADVALVLFICNTFFTVVMRFVPFIPPSIQHKNLACWRGVRTFRMPSICFCMDSILLVTYMSTVSFPSTFPTFFWISSTISITEAMFSCCRSNPPRL